MTNYFYCQMRIQGVWILRLCPVCISHCEYCEEDLNRFIQCQMCKFDFIVNNKFAFIVSFYCSLFKQPGLNTQSVSLGHDASSVRVSKHYKKWCLFSDSMLSITSVSLLLFQVALEDVEHASIHWQEEDITHCDRCSIGVYVFRQFLLYRI